MDLIREGIVKKVRNCLRCGKDFMSKDGCRLCDGCNAKNQFVRELPTAHDPDHRRIKDPRSE